MIVWVNNTYNGLIEQQQPHKKYEEIEERATITVLHRRRNRAKRAS